ncbi:MAG: hypothetical protein JO001_10375 [Alphaproteobacteria bacterium]|nr:hypothetical protein [Alphaproteobacteria bacterium]
MSTTAVMAQTMASPSAKMPGGEYTTEADAKDQMHRQCGVAEHQIACLSLARARDYGHTKNGAYMCQPDADKIGCAAKNEKPPSK